ncbi:hypothetical protein CPB83DRAFT_839966 [Crepidotus variabilis]|uniref:Uncharacterized protein n=1 Tax=Crepidotus variabilis TaxID=179855 RepID=A0A9P6E5R0_9AGAR|nr:hypothetical protein CPB83DRAFT_839966 [Crepidotus variabilis]
MSVAVVAGTLSGIIAILAAVLVFVVISMRKRSQRRMLHEMMDHSGSAFQNEQGWSPHDGPNRRWSRSSSTYSSSSKPYFEYISSPSEYSARKFMPKSSTKTSSPRSRDVVSDLGLAPSLSSRSNSLSPIRMQGDVPPAYLDSRG